MVLSHTETEKKCIFHCPPVLRVGPGTAEFLVPWVMKPLAQLPSRTLHLQLVVNPESSEYPINRVI